MVSCIPYAIRSVVGQDLQSTCDAMSLWPKGYKSYVRACTLYG